MAGEMDGGAAVHLTPDSLTVVGGALIKEPAKIESGLKKLAEIAAKEPDFAGVQWNAATHDGINFHTLTVPVPEDDPEARQMLGEKVDVAVGIGPDAVYVAIGKDNLDAVNQAIDASKAEPGKEVPQFEFSMSLAQVMAVGRREREGRRSRERSGHRRHAEERRRRPRSHPHDREADRERPHLPLRSRRRRAPRHRQSHDDGPAKGPAGSDARGTGAQ